MKSIFIFLKYSLLFFLLIVAGCHCPSPVGFCAHDLYYLMLGLPFLGTLRLRLYNFHWWRHEKCEHHPKGEKCKNHDHVQDKALNCTTEEKDLQRLWNRIYEEEIPSQKTEEDHLLAAWKKINEHET